MLRAMDMHMYNTPLTKSDGDLTFRVLSLKLISTSCHTLKLGGHLPPLQAMRQSPSTKPGSDTALEAANFNQTCRPFTS